MDVQRSTPDKLKAVFKQRGWSGKYTAVMGLVLAVLTAPHACAEDADTHTDESEHNALLLTQILESEGDLAHPPEFSVQERTVYTVIDGSPTEARERCLLIESLVERYDLVFAKGWTAQVTTEDADGEALASCPL